MTPDYHARDFIITDRQAKLWKAESRFLQEHHRTPAEPCVRYFSIDYLDPTERKFLKKIHYRTKLRRQFPDLLREGADDAVGVGIHRLKAKHPLYLYASGPLPLCDAR